jgi:hypothetical protein
MIKLKNITKIGNIVYADVYSVEAHPIHFEIAVDIYDKKLVKNTHEKMDSLSGMALAKLIKLSEEYGDKIPKQAESVWY